MKTAAAVLKSSLVALVLFAYSSNTIASECPKVAGDYKVVKVQHFGDHKQSFLVSGSIFAFQVNALWTYDKRARLIENEAESSEVYGSTGVYLFDNKTRPADGSNTDKASADKVYRADYKAFCFANSMIIEQRGVGHNSRQAFSYYEGFDIIPLEKGSLKVIQVRTVWGENNSMLFTGTKFTYLKKVSN